MNLSISFEPLFSITLLAIVLVPLLLIVGAGLLVGQRGSLFRLAALGALALALFNPVLLDEEREPLSSVVAVVLDESQSQEIGNRAETARAALEGLKERLSRFGQFELRVAETSNSNAEERTETRAFEALEGLLRDVPPSRVAGSIMITDG